ncbi:MAG: hypothetical protein ACKO0Z_22105 [Betaproteobacteria bacterium]
MTQGALVKPHAGIPAMATKDIQFVRELEIAMLKTPQAEMVTRHVIHAGMYARTVRIPAGVVIAGAEIKLATLLIVSGHVLVTVGDKAMELVGYHVLPASSGRKQAFYAKADTDLTMVFTTSASSVEEAEHQFTDEADRLLSRQWENDVVITGE